MTFTYVCSALTIIIDNSLLFEWLAKVVMEFRRAVASVAALVNADGRERAFKNS